MNTLSDLRWFSFAEDVDKANSLTVWQAVGNILKHASKAGTAFDEYFEQLTRLETDSAKDIVDFNDAEGTATQFRLGDEIESVSPEDFRTDTHYLDNIVLGSDEIDEALYLLDMNRQKLVDSLPLPGLLHRFLMAEIDSVNFGLPSQIELVTNDFQPLIKRTSLKDWRESKNLDSLHLVTADKMVQRRKIRDDANENEMLVTGMLLQLLQEAAPKDYAKNVGKPGQKVSMNKVADAMLERVKDGNFPGKSTIYKTLTSAKKLLKDEVKLKPSA